MGSVCSRGNIVKTVIIVKSKIVKQRLKCFVFGSRGEQSLQRLHTNPNLRSIINYNRKRWNMYRATEYSGIRVYVDCIFKTLLHGSLSFKQCHHSLPCLHHATIQTTSTSRSEGNKIAFFPLNPPWSPSLLLSWSGQWNGSWKKSFRHSGSHTNSFLAFQNDAIEHSSTPKPKKTPYARGLGLGSWQNMSKIYFPPIPSSFLYLHSL